MKDERPQNLTLHRLSAVASARSHGLHLAVCQRLMEAIQRGETAGGVCCEAQTIRHAAHRHGV